MIKRNVGKELVCILLVVVLMGMPLAAMPQPVMGADGQAKSTGTTQQEDFVLWNMPDDLVPDMTLQHPRVYYDSSNLATAQANLSDGTGWAQTISDDIVESLQSEPWFQMSDAELLSHIPEAGSYYTYMATNVCPDGSLMSPIGWEQPGKVQCASGAMMPDADHPDDGTGWQDDEGNMYYFVARWNGFVIQEIEKALPKLAHAYAFTGDPIYAHKASLMLDAVASIYPQAIEGPFDYPGAALGREGGRLQRPQYQVARSLVMLVEAVDLIWDSTAFNEASATNPEATVKQNVVYNLLLNAADYCYRQTHKPGFVDQLHNGTADYNMGVLAVGSLLGIEHYIDWALNGPTSIHNMIVNNIDRDGNYFETAASYSQYTQGVYLEFAEILYHLQTSEYPSGINLYQDPRFERFYVDYLARNSIAGRLALYGDSLVDTKTDTETEFNQLEFSNLLKFYARTDNPVKRVEYAQKLQNMAEGEPNLLLNSAWSVMNLTGGIQETDPSSTVSERPAEWFGGKGLVFLRTGEGAHKRGAMLRYGATLNHGQYDELAFLMYDVGRELSFDPGYDSAQYRVGWQQHTVAHLTTVVNEKSQFSAESSGGSMNFFSTEGDINVVDVSDEGAYASEGVSLYRRLLGLVDTSDTSSYMVDIFRVNGGDTRDYSFHSRGDRFETSGLNLSEPAPGSVASPDYDWGDKIREDGYITGFEDEGYYYVAEPGNGYGFLGNPRNAQTDGQWSATWSSDAAKLRLTMLPQDGREIITARGPSPMNGVTYLLARDEGDQPSQYVSVIETGAADSMPNRNISPMTVTEQPEGLLEPVALTVTEGNVTDYILSTLAGQPFSAENDEGRTVTTDAEWAMVREDRDGIKSVQITKGTHLALNDFAVSGFQPELSGNVIDVDFEVGSLLVQSADPLGGAFEGSQILLDNEAYSHNSPYTIKRIVPEGENYRIFLDPGTLLLAKGKVEGTPSGSDLPNLINLPYSRNVARLGANEYFTGKTVTNGGDGTARIESVKDDYAGLSVDQTSDFQDGDDLYIYDVQSGDQFSIPITVRVDRQENGTYTVNSPVPVITPFTTSADMKTLVERFEDEGQFASDSVAHALRLHLTAVERFEQQEIAKKVVKHMEGFKALLDHQKDNDMIYAGAYRTLMAGTETLIKQWQTK